MACQQQYFHRQCGAHSLRVIKMLIRGWLSICVSITFVIVLAPSVLAQRSEITFSRIDPIGRKCVMVYGSLSFGGSDFLIRDCGGAANVKTKLSIGYIDKMIFADEESAWFVVRGTLVKVRITDEGKAFQFAVADGMPDVQINDGFFINKQCGWLSGTGGTILKTKDGGTPWERQQSGTDIDLKEIKFFNAQDGWVRGSGYKDGRTVSVALITRDGGNSWISLDHAIGMELAPIYLTSLSHGCGIDDDSAIVCSNNLNAWRVSYSDKGTRATKSAMFFLNPKLGWVVGDSIWSTADGGNAWTTQLELPSGTSFPFEQVVFVDEKLGWARALTDVWRTSNGGKSCEKISDRWTSLLQQ